MFQEPPREKEWQGWLFFSAWALFVVRIAPLTRGLLRELIRHTDRSLLVHGTIAVTIAAGLAGAVYVIRHPRLRGVRHVPWLAAVVAAYAYMCLHHLKSPQDALHFLEYGFLGLLAFRALAHRLRDAAIYPAAILVCALVGNVDEILQWLVPGRISDVRDWAWDLVAAALAQVAIAGGMRPPFIAWRPAARSARVVVRLLAVQVALMAACFLNTPARGVWLGWHVPGLRSLTWHENVMTEYGYRHRDPDIGTFYSRFTLEELRRLDATRFEDAAECIRTYRDGAGFMVFLREVNAGVDPFTHEAYVRINRRNHYVLSSHRHTNDVPRYRFHCLVAFRENRILEKYFAKTTGFAGETMSTAEFDRARKDMAELEPYVSPVSDHLIIGFNERQVMAVALLLLVALFAVDRRLSRHA
jgi:hypothetical protein